MEVKTVKLLLLFSVLHAITVLCSRKKLCKKNIRSSAILKNVYEKKNYNYFYFQIIKDKSNLAQSTNNYNNKRLKFSYKCSDEKNVISLAKSYKGLQLITLFIKLLKVSSINHF